MNVANYSKDFECLMSNNIRKEMVNPVGNWAYWDEIRLQELERGRNNLMVGERLVLETDTFKVWAIHLPAGNRLPFHRHQSSYFWTALSTGKSRSYYHDGSVVDTEYQMDDTVYFSNLSEDNFFIHNLENIGSTTLIFSTIEFK